jgi:hypothetical protein
MRIRSRMNEKCGDLGCLVGFEPTSSGATVRRSTAELQAPHGGIPQPLIIATARCTVRSIDRETAGERSAGG